MARQIGSTYTGTTWDGLTFYHNRLHGYLVRRTGGVTSKQYRRDARYAAARDASREFSSVSGAGKLIRQALADFLPAVKDGTMVNRMNRELVALKQLDNIHHRGERRPETMMADAAANRHFRIFQFNDAVRLYDLTEQFPVVLRQPGKLAIRNVRLKAFPEGATHAGLALVRTVIDFDAKRFHTCSSAMAVVTNGLSADLSLPLPAAASCAGTELICVQVLFFRLQNGDLVQLKEKVHAMGMVAVGMSRTFTEATVEYSRPPRPHMHAETPLFTADRHVIPDFGIRGSP